MNTVAAIARLVAVVSTTLPPPLTTITLVATLSASYRYHPSNGPHPAIDNDDVYIVFCLRCSLCAARLGGRAADVNGEMGLGNCIWHFSTTFCCIVWQHLKQRPVLPSLVAFALATFRENLCAPYGEFNGSHHKILKMTSAPGCSEAENGKYSGCKLKCRL